MLNLKINKFSIKTLVFDVSDSSTDNKKTGNQEEKNLLLKYLTNSSHFLVSPPETQAPQFDIIAELN